MEVVYYEEFIKKRELKDRWVQFWARLIGEKIYLYVSRDCKDVDFCEIIWLSSCSRCVLLKRRTYSFRFRLTTSEGSYYLKCDSNLQRHRWIHMIHLASSGRLPELPPNHINMRCCYQEDKTNEIVHGKSIKQSPSIMENVKEERETAREMSDGKETSGEDEMSKKSPRGSSNEEIAEMEKMECGHSKQITNKSTGSMSSRKSINPTGKEMTHTLEGANKESENDIKAEGSSCAMENDKAHDSSITASSNDKTSPAPKQTFSFKTFAFGSFRKSLKRQSYPPKRKKEPAPSKDQRNSISHSSYDEKFAEIKYSMDNPAFTDDDIEGFDKRENGYQTARIINVASCTE